MFFIKESRFRKLKYSGHDKIGFKAQKNEKSASGTGEIHSSVSKKTCLVCQNNTFNY